MKGLQLPKGDKEVAAEIEFQRYFLYSRVEYRYKAGKK